MFNEGSLVRVMIGSSENVLFNDSMEPPERLLSKESFKKGFQGGCSCLFEGVDDAKWLIFS